MYLVIRSHLCKIILSPVPSFTVWCNIHCDGDDGGNVVKGWVVMVMVMVMVT